MQVLYWTKTGNISSAKMGFINEAMFYMNYLPDDTNKIIVLKKATHIKRNETLAAFETVLFMLIIIFTQKAFEVWCKRGNIPYGGIIGGITWGLAHTFTKGSIWIGL